MAEGDLHDGKRVEMDMSAFQDDIDASKVGWDRLHRRMENQRAGDRCPRCGADTCPHCGKVLPRPWPRLRYPPSSPLDPYRPYGPRWQSDWRSQEIG